MEILNQIKGWLLILSGSACLVIALVCLIKMLTGEETETRTYMKRIKNAGLSFALILMITTINSTVIKYFPDDNVGIGTMDATLTGQDTSIFSGGTEVTDIQGRKVIIATYENSSYALVQTDTKEIKSGNIFTLWQESSLKRRGINYIYIWRIYGDAQSTMKGYGKEIYFYSFTNNFSNTELGKLYFCYGFSDLNYININQDCYNAIISNFTSENSVGIDTTSVSDLIKILETYYDYCNIVDLKGYASQITMYENGVRQGNPINF